VGNINEAGFDKDREGFSESKQFTVALKRDFRLSFFTVYDTYGKDKAMLTRNFFSRDGGEDVKLATIRQARFMDIFFEVLPKFQADSRNKEHGKEGGKHWMISEEGKEWPLIFQWGKNRVAEKKYHYICYTVTHQDSEQKHTSQWQV